MGSVWTVQVPPPANAQKPSALTPPRLLRRPCAGRTSITCPSRNVAVKASVQLGTDQHTSSSESSEAGAFIWTRAWYPLARESDLEHDRPTKLEVLGKSLVCWRDGSGDVKVVDDACPHKLAPLSLGKVTKEGDLMCRYHGYCFNGEGECTRLPMAVTESSEATARRLPQSKVTSYPTQISQGLLWVWPDDSPTRWVDAQMHEPAPTSRAFGPLIMQEAPIDFTMFLENTFDPCHANFLHEGLGFGANKYSPESAIPMAEFKIDGNISPSGFMLKHGGYSQSTAGQLATRTFSAPVTADTVYVKPEGVMYSRIHFVPVRPGRTRFFVAFEFGPPSEAQRAELAASKEGAQTEQQKQVSGSGKPKASQLTKLAMVARFALPSILMKLFPKYVGEAFRHTAGSKLGDQDNAVMAGTERWMQARNQVRPMGKWSEEYALLTPSDQGVVAFRRWMDRFGSGGPWDGPMPFHDVRVTQEQLLDRWSGHSKHCSSCRKTVDLFARLATITSNLAIAFGVTALVAVAALHGGPSQVPCVLAVLGLLCHAAHLKFRSAQRRFITGVPAVGEGVPEVDPWKGYH